MAHGRGEPPTTRHRRKSSRLPVVVNHQVKYVKGIDISEGEICEAAKRFEELREREARKPGGFIWRGDCYDKKIANDKPRPRACT